MDTLAPQSWIVFLLALYPMNLLAILLHELGHVLAARAIGVRIWAWGIGASRVFFHMAIGDQQFYLGRPLSLGLTIAEPRSLDRQPIADAIFILGGPIATVAGLGAGIVLWSWGIRSDILLAWLAISGFLSLASAVPFVIKTGRQQFVSDAGRLWQLAIWGRENRIASLGVALSNAECVATLLEQAGSRRGAALMSTVVHILEASLGNHQAARHGLFQIDADALKQSATGEAMAALAWAVTSVEANDDDAYDRIEYARHLFKDDNEAKFSTDVLHLQWMHRRGLDVRERLANLRTQATQSSRRDWLCTVDALRFDFDDSFKPDDECERLLTSYRGFMSVEAQSGVLAIATERLAKCDSLDRAHGYFERAQTTISQASASIADPATREMFVCQTAAPLQRAVAATPPDKCPLFISDFSGTVPGRQGSGSRPNRQFFCFATFASGITALMFSVLSVGLGPGQPTSKAAGMVLLVMLFFVLGLVTTLVSILRQERRYTYMWAGLLLATLGVAIAVVVDVNRKRTVSPRFRDAAQMMQSQHV
ncbi:MAG: site-2 protease family protein [Pirellulales bacterium]